MFATGFRLHERIGLAGPWINLAMADFFLLHGLLHAHGDGDFFQQDFALVMTHFWENLQFGIKK